MKRARLFAMLALLVSTACGTRAAEQSQPPAPQGQGQPTAQAAQAGQPAAAQGGKGTAAPAAAPAAPKDGRGSVLSKQLKTAVTADEINAVSNRFYLSGTGLPAKHAVDWYGIEFQSTDKAEKPLKLQAQVFAPKAENAASLPIYVFGPGTTGLNDGCAPSNEQPSSRNWGDFQSHMLTYATQGYMAIMPDYEGFNDGPEIHHYYVGEQQARVMLDAARAALRFFDDGQAAGKKDTPVFFAGYSHGGYVTFAAKDLAEKYAPEVKIAGAIGYGPRSDPATLFKDMPSLGPLVLYSYANYYGGDKVPFDKLIQQRWLPTLEKDVTSKCIDEIPTYYGTDPKAVYTPEFLAALDNRDLLAQQFPTLRELFDKNKHGLGGKSVPVLVLHGTKDTVVYPETMQRYMQEACAAGHKARYIAYPDVPHTLIRQTGFQDAMSWMQAVQGGQAPKSDC